MQVASNRVKIAKSFASADFARYENEAALVFCDIKSAEEELLNPELAQALRSLDFVESHKYLRKGITQKK